MTKNNIQKVGKRWFFALMIFLWGCIVLCGYIVISIVDINKYNELSNKIDRILITSHKSTVSAKDFIMNAYTDESFVKKGTNKSFENFNLYIDTVYKLTQEFKKSEFMNTDEKKLALAELDSSLNTYRQGFYSIADNFKQKGFKDLGLEGDMRDAIHFIENHEAPIDLEYLLTLRRHEKDFLLRKDYKYVEKFNVDVIKFEDHIKANTEIYPEFHRQDILDALEKYRITFDKIVELEKLIGLTPEEGLKNDFTKTLARMEEILEGFNAEIKFKKTRASYAINIIIVSIIVVFILIITGVFFSVSYLNNSVLKPINKLNAAADQIAEGNLSVNLEKLKKMRLMRDLVMSFEKLIEKLRLTILHIEQISARKISTFFELKNENDEIGISLNKIIGELQHIDIEEKNRTWVNEGLTKFGDIVRSTANLNVLSNQVIAFLVKYLNANQGGLYILANDGKKDFLKLEAAYAYNRKKYLEKSIEIGEGLVGQCYKEKQMTYMIEVPENYLNITSGFGYATPRALLIAPMINNESVEAIVELASFQPFEQHHKDFINKIGEVLASSIANVKVNQLTNILLEESKLQSEQMRAQEEEMRQNLEEMMATQEEVSRKEVGYKQEIENLKTDCEDYKLQIEKLKETEKLLQSQLSENGFSKEGMNGSQNLDHGRIRNVHKYPRRIENFLES